MNGFIRIDKLLINTAHIIVIEDQGSSRKMTLTSDGKHVLTHTTTLTLDQLQAAILNTDACTIGKV